MNSEKNVFFVAGFFVVQAPRLQPMKLALLYGLDSATID